MLVLQPPSGFCREPGRENLEIRETISRPSGPDLTEPGSNHPSSAFKLLYLLPCAPRHIPLTAAFLCTAPHWLFLPAILVSTRTITTLEFVNMIGFGAAVFQSHRINVQNARPPLGESKPCQPRGAISRLCTDISAYSGMNRPPGALDRFPASTSSSFLHFIQASPDQST